jgi:prevent-host-death family protein
METIQYIPKTALARKTRQIIQAVQRGQTIVIENHGQPEAAIIDIIDYRLLRAVLHYHTNPPQIDPRIGLDDKVVSALESAQEQINLVIAHYLGGVISLSRAAELLDLSWLDLRTRFLRLDIPLRIAPNDQDGVMNDLENANSYTIAM